MKSLKIDRRSILLTATPKNLTKFLPSGKPQSVVNAATLGSVFSGFFQAGEKKKKKYSGEM